MTKEELKAKLAEMHLDAMSDLSYKADATQAMLDAAGKRGRTNAEAVLETFRYHEKKIEKFLQAWEKANPR